MPADVKGVQTPRVFTAPPYHYSAGQEAVELAAAVGLHLDPWQQHVLKHGLGEREDGKWSAFEVVVNVPRQNGKGGIIEARELAGMFLFNEKLIIHSSHEFKTTKEAMRRLVGLIENSDMLRRRVKHIRTTTGQEAIELRDGRRICFLARSKGAGRGFTADCVILDEAMILGDAEMSAIGPTQAAVPNPQRWYLGSAGIGDQSVQLGRLRRLALEGTAPALAYNEWSISPHADECLPGCTEHDDVDSPESWAKANPAMGIRVSQSFIANERMSMATQAFATERLGVGVYPSEGGDGWKVIAEDAWRALTDPSSEPSDPVVFSIDATPERSHAAIGVAGASGEQTHIEVVDHRPGIKWVVARVVELVERWEAGPVIVDEGGPAGSLIPDLVAAGVEVRSPKVREIAQACGQLYDAVTEQTVVHLDQANLAVSLAGAEQRPLGDAWAWARKSENVDISPLMAVTLAAWGLLTREEAEGAPNLW